MPRDGSGVYQSPAGTHGVSGNTIFSAAYNTNVDDVANDLNYPRPISAGGTGATTALDARANLHTEVAYQLVTNYDTMQFEAGTFISDTSAISAPVSGHYFLGYAMISGTDFAYLEAHDLSDGVSPHAVYLREKNGGAWTPWAKIADTREFAMDARYVNVGGDTMTGALTVNGSISTVGNNITVNTALQLQSDGTNGVINSPNDLYLRAGSPSNILHVGDAGGLVNIGNAGSSSFVLGNLIVHTALNLQSDGTNSSIVSNNDLALRAGAGKILRVGDAGGAVQVANSGSATFVMGPLNVAGNTSQFGNAPMPSPDPWIVKFGYANYGIGFRGTTDGFACGFYNPSNSVVGTISTSATATSYNTSSDARLKDDLQAFDAGRIVDDTEVYNFKWRSTGERSYGVSAQQAAEVFPQAVTHNESTDWWGVDYSKYVPVILQELKTLRARLATIEAQAGPKSRG